MTILITGSSGLIGSALTAFLKSQGHDVIRLVRDEAHRGPNDRLWLPDSGVLDTARLEGVDAVVHLAGANLAAGRWSESRRNAIRESRVGATQLLCETLAQLRRPPSVLASASAVGIYGNRGGEVLTEESSPGTGFLAQVGQQWEASTQPAMDRGIRVVHLRFGIVLSSKGGALAKMLFPFRMALGGVIGSGEQYWSWITIDDAVAAIQHALRSEQISGPLNVVSPAPVTNREFTRTLGAALGRPAWFRVPAVMARIVFGEMADETLLASTRVAPAKLLSTDFRFLQPGLSKALLSLLPK